MTRTIRRRYVVHGLVQGVGFRYATREAASRLGLAGSVQNEFDGTVLVHAEGAPQAIDDFEGWLHEGPAFAEVTAVDRKDERPTGAEGFDVLV